MSKNFLLRIQALFLALLVLSSSIGLNFVHEWCKCSGKEAFAFFAAKEEKACCSLKKQQEPAKSCCKHSTKASTCGTEQTDAFLGSWASLGLVKEELRANCCGQEFLHFALELEGLPEVGLKLPSHSSNCPLCKAASLPMRAQIVLPQNKYPQRASSYYKTAPNKAPPQSLYAHSIDYLNIIQVYRC